MTSPDEVGFERPEGYTDAEWAAYRAGAQAMLELTGSMLFGMAADLDGDVDGEESGPPTCDECDRELLDTHQMGQSEPVCPHCDLLSEAGGGDAENNSEP